MYLPLNYEQINNIVGRIRPSTVHAYNSAAFDFWQRALYHRLLSVIEWDGLPEEWKNEPKNLFDYVLTRAGYLVVSKDNEHGLYFQPCTLKGFTMYYQPKSAVFTNPAWKKQQEIVLRKDGELIRLTPDYMGVFDIIDYYAEKLALIEPAVNSSIVNSKLAYIVSAKTKAGVETLKKIIDKVNEGNPAVFYDNRVLDASPTEEDTNPFRIDKIFSQGDYITDKLLTDKESILRAFDTEIGIPTLPYEKKERLVTTEADSKKQESSARVTVWLKCLTESLERVNNMFGTNISVKYAYESEVNTDETDNAGDVQTDEISKQ